MVHALRNAGFNVHVEVALPIIFDGVSLGSGDEVDMLVDNAVIVELKAVDRVLAVHKAQLLSYLRLSHKSAGLLINVHVARLVDGVHRVVNNYRPA